MQQDRLICCLKAADRPPGSGLGWHVQLAHRWGREQLPRSAEPMLRQFFTDLFRQFDVTPHAA
jgi:hypothetical protein